MSKTVDAASEEFVRQFIIAAFAILVIIAQRELMPGLNPDSNKQEGKMRRAKMAENFAQRQAEWWARTADRFKRAYDSYRN